MQMGFSARKILAEFIQCMWHITLARNDNGMNVIRYYARGISKSIYNPSVRNLNYTSTWNYSTPNAYARTLSREYIRLHSVNIAQLIRIQIMRFTVHALSTIQIAAVFNQVALRFITRALFKCTCNSVLQHFTRLLICIESCRKDRQIWQLLQE